MPLNQITPLVGIPLSQIWGPLVSNDNTVRYKRLALQIPAGRHRRHYVKARVRVHEYPDGTMAVFHGPRCLARYHADGQPIDSQTREAA